MCEDTSKNAILQWCVAWVKQDSEENGGGARRRGRSDMVMIPVWSAWLVT